jgi:hypothetical protein
MQATLSQFRILFLFDAAVVPGPGCSGSGGGGGGGCTGSDCNPNPTFTEAVITGGPYAMVCPGTTTFDASASTAFDGGVLKYTWEFYDAVSDESFELDAGNQAVYQLPLLSQASMQMGATYEVLLTVEDSEGAQRCHESATGGNCFHRRHLRVGATHILIALSHCIVHQLPAACMSFGIAVML